uniref:Uncharacterized protein n=1 Tax=Tanacetum cinerariifolium TaxID=118510 RepID=A0A6L2NQ46_TANCI|nr:hypothetical protein [Tanacetum cinerariifolium]
MFRLLKELTTSKAPEKVLIKEEAKHPVTKNVNSISLIRGKEELNVDDNATSEYSIKRPDRSDTEVQLNEFEKKNEAENGTKNELIKSPEKEPTEVEEEESTEAPSSQPVRNSRGRVSGCFWPCVPRGLHDFKHKGGRKRPFILGSPFLTTTKVVIKFDKETITLRSGKSKISFHRIPKPNCKIEKGIKNDIEPIAPTMTVNRLVLEWEERIKLHQEKDMEFNQCRSKTFENKHPVFMKEKRDVEDEGKVT